MSAQTSDIRKPAVAGLFYPSSPSQLVKKIAQLYSEVKKAPLEGPPLALVCPHAGYPYSGRIAARAFKLIDGEQYDAVVIISPSHTVFFKGASVYDGAGYETPLGVVEIDKALSKKIATIHPQVYFSNMGHASGSTRGEHALEVQLPFLQVILGKFKLVAIVMGDQEEDTINAVGETLASALKGTNTLMVASTDLSHFHSEDAARKLDSSIQRAIEQYNPELLVETLESGKGEACGGGVVASVMKACQRLGGQRAQFLEYTTSGEATGDFQEVVGYLSAVIVGTRQAKETALIGASAAKQEFSLADEDKKFLLKTAREAIEAALKGKKYTPVHSEKLEVHRGVFVTLEVDNELRGCIGMIKARGPLYEAVAEMAVSAAMEDPRFPQLEPDEFPHLKISISVLSRLERVHDLSNIEVGRDGLLIKMDMHSGLLLPQVASEHGWDRTEFLEQTCLKAGLPKNSYKDSYAEIYKFTADIFE